MTISLNLCLLACPLLWIILLKTAGEASALPTE